MCACCSEGETTWRHNITPAHWQQGGRNRHRREDRGALPSKGVRLEPPFFPSSPCCEYCFRRFWALRMVPGPINTEIESRGGGAARSRQPRNRRNRRKKKEEEEGRARKWVMKHRHHQRDRQQRFVCVGGREGGWRGEQPSTTGTQQDDQARDRAATATSWKHTRTHVCSNTRRPRSCRSRINRLGQM